MPLNKLYSRFFPLGLATKLILMLAVVILTSQLVSSFIWYQRYTAKEESGLQQALENIARSAAYTISYYRKLPSGSRHLVLEQNRSMGGTRFFSSLNTNKINQNALPQSKRQDFLIHKMQSAFNKEVEYPISIDISFVLRSEMKVFDNSTPIDEVPRFYARYTLEKGHLDTPILVIQAKLTDLYNDNNNEWFFLATTLPTPYTQLESKIWDTKQLYFLFISSMMIFLFTWIMIRKELQPIKALANAAKQISCKMSAPIIKEKGSGELVNAVTAFNTMSRKVRSHIRDRDVLFGAISHDLKTPIACLKLRTEMLENHQDKMHFETILSELEFMLKGALQCIKDTDIQEELEWVDINVLLSDFDAFYNHKNFSLTVNGKASKPLLCKPISFKRMLNNLIENGIKYGTTVNVNISEESNNIIFNIKDNGPGIKDNLREKVFEPYFRIEKEREEGTGLGLSIVRQILRSHSGEMTLNNHPDGGLIIKLIIPREYG